MALVSPGVQVTVVDESFYTPASPGTLPMIFVASRANKLNGAGTGTAPGTLAENIGTPYLITSQRDLVDTFGDPIFQIDNNNNPIHGSELNEYGLQAAYSYLGIANQAFVVRAGIDLGQLEATATAPADSPPDGTYWFDTANTLWGIQEWNGASVLNGGQNFTNKVPTVITDTTELNDAGSLVANGFEGPAPSPSVGAIGEYAVVATTTLNRIYYRNNAGTWVLVGSDAWTKSWPTITAANPNPTFQAGGAILINGTSVSIAGSDTVNDVALTINTLAIPGVSAAVVASKLELYSDGTSSAAEDSTQSGEIFIGGDTTRLEELGITAGTYYSPLLQISKHTQVPEFKTTDVVPRPTGSVWVKTTTPNLGAKYNVKKWNNALQTWQAVALDVYLSNTDALYQMDRTGGGLNLLAGDLYVHANVAEDTVPLATFKLMRRTGLAPTTISTSTITGLGTGQFSFTLRASQPGEIGIGDEYTITSTFTNSTSDSLVLSGSVNNAGIPNVTAKVVTGNKVVFQHEKGGEIRFSDIGGSPAFLATMGLSADTTQNLNYTPGTDGDTTPLSLQGSLWAVLTYTASDTEVTALTANDSLWYNSIVDEPDILVHNGKEFVGYLYPGQGGQSVTPSPYYNADADLQTDPNGPIVGATVPVKQSDGTELRSGDLWIDTSDIENYPKLYKFNELRQDLPVEARWFLVDTGDQTTEDGILFADARYNTAGSNSDKPGDISDLLYSDYVDVDSPDPALYPKGMLLFNLRRSGFNVKKYQRNYVDTAKRNIRYNDQSMESYARDRWVTESGNQPDGSGSFGRKAQRKVIIQSIQALINANQDIRDNETRLFNLMACPGYSECIGEMVSLNYDRGLTAFIVGDSPFRLEPNGTILNNWASNVNLALEDNEVGLTTTDPYSAIFYPSGYTSDNFGNNVVVPASHMMLRTMALSDQVAYPWFAPAGTRRGNITNASATGYITSEGEFKSVSLNEGLRDILYANSVNPITFLTGIGLVNFGQKTRQLVASSLDRINVARLVIYLRQQLNILAKPYLFEPNDKTTRDEIKGAVETLMLELVGLRALYDFLVVCDESNNTPARIDRNELYVDIAIEPVKAIEFIYIPLRLKNTGEISGL